MRPVVIEILKTAGVISDKSDAMHLLIINILSYIVVSVAVVVLFRIIGKALDWFFSLPIIGFFNKIGGLLFGFLLAVTFCAFVFSIVSISGEWVNIEKFTKMIDESVISTYFYENNLFLLLQ